LSRNYHLRVSRAPTADPTGLGQPAGLRTGARESAIGSAIHVRRSEPPNWFTPQGVYKKRKQIERRGMPDTTGRRFLTFSIDPELFDHCPLTAYLNGKEKLRRVLEAGRLAGLWSRGCWWAWKLEFQRNGWPHWHFIIDRTAKFTTAEMRKVSEIWGYGRTNCRRISKSRFGYQFKYAFKGVYQDQESDADQSPRLAVPQWFLNYYKPSVDGSKPESFARCRFWQTSKGFYTKSAKPAVPSSEPVSAHVPVPVAQVVQDRQASITVVSRDTSGKYVKSATLHLGVVVSQFVRVHLWGAEHGQGCTLSVRSFIMDRHGINQVIRKHEKWKLTELLKANRLSLRKARQIRQAFKTLETY